MRLLFLVLALAFASGCATNPKLIPEVSPAHPLADEKSSSSNSLSDVETVVLMGINDFHGALAPIQLRETGSDSPDEYETGGATILASYVRILKEEHGQNLVVLDAGDEYQGTIDSHLEKGSP